MLGSATKGKRKKVTFEGKMMLLSLLPFLALVFLFSYLPLYGWVYAFYDYRVPMKLSDAEFVGLQWFKMMFLNETQRGILLQVIKNTLGMSMLGVATSMLPLFFAIFLNEIGNKRFRSTVQTFTTIPNFISWVLVYVVAFSFFSTSGMVNNVLLNLGLIDAPISFLDSSEHVWIKMQLWSLWKGLGWGAILYLASISSISEELYEAARVDGANRFQLMRHITFPSLMPTYIVLLMLSIANFLNNGMEQYYIFQNPFNKTYIQVLDLYVYNIGITGNSTSFTTAISMLKSVISLTLLVTVNAISKKTRGSHII